MEHLSQVTDGLYKTIPLCFLRWVHIGNVWANVDPTLKRLEKSSKRGWNSRSRAQNFGSHLERLGSNVRHRLETFADGG